MAKGYQAKTAIVESAAGLAKGGFTKHVAQVEERWIRREVKCEIDSLLRDALEAELCVLCEAPSSPGEPARPVLAENLDEVIDGIDWWPDPPSARFRGRPIELRLYRPNRFAVRERGSTATGDVSPAPTLGRTRPSKGKLYALGSDEVKKLDDPGEHFASHGAKMAFARELAGKSPFKDRPYTVEAIARELRNVVGDRK